MKTLPKFRDAHALGRILACLACMLLLVLSTVAAGPDVAASAPTAGQKKIPPKPLYQGKRAPVGKGEPAPGAPLGMEQAVHRALRHNPSLGAAEAQAKSSEEGRKSARGSFGPKLGTTYGVSSQKRDTSPVSSVKPPELGTYTWSVEISQPVFQGFRLLANYQKAALQAESDKASQFRSELAMTEQVQTYFLAYLRAEENVVSQRDELDRLRDQLRITTAYYDVGLRPRLDVLQAEVDVSQAESLLIQVENTRDTSLSMLNTLLGLSATANARYAGKLVHVPFRRSLEQCIEAAYRQRPDLYIAEKAVEIAGKDQQTVQSQYYPHIEAYYNVTQSGNTPGLQREGDYGSRSQTWEVGGRVTWDAFQWGTTYYADKQAGWLVTKMRYEEENLKLNVGHDVKSKLLAVREAEKRIGVARKGVEQATEAYKVALARYQEQVGTNFDVLNASSNLTSAQAALTSARADYLTALSQLYVSMGEFHPDLLRP